MKLDRNINGAARGKYGLIKTRRIEELRKLNGCIPANIADALFTLAECGVLDWGATPETEFFVMRLKDQYAISGLYSYGLAALKDDPEYGGEVIDLAKRAGPYHPSCKKPD